MQYLYVWAVLQIVLESLPISSSGNVVLWMHVVQRYLDAISFPIHALDFDFLLHGPSILVIAAYFWKEWFQYVYNYRKKFRFIILIGVYCAWADLLTAVWYLVFKATGTSWLPLSVGFLITAASLLSLKFFRRTDQSGMRLFSMFDATILGMVQGVALLPGLSRFGLTFVAARYLGYSPVRALQYSFLIQIPLIGAAFLKGCYSLYWFEYKAQLLHPLFGLTILIATVVSYFALCFVGKVIQQKKTYLFGWYVLSLAGVAALIGK
jgi:undecaprenyl-diphosphatase